MMNIEWWHWMVLGVALMLLELAMPAFFLIWFGLGAFIVGMIMLAAPAMTLGIQVAVWIVASVGFVILWQRVFKVQVHRTKVGMSEGQFSGEVGLVTREIRPFQKGQIRFQKPILGSDVWEAIAEEDIRAGDRVDVIDVEGNILRVAKRK